MVYLKNYGMIANLTTLLSCFGIFYYFHYEFTNVKENSLCVNEDDEIYEIMDELKGRLYKENFNLKKKEIPKLIPLKNKNHKDIEPDI